MVVARVWGRGDRKPVKGQKAKTNGQTKNPSLQVLNNLIYYNTVVYFFGIRYVFLKHVNDIWRSSEFLK